MTLSEDLFDLSRELAERDPRKPKQAHLRRAISTAYYAVFHFLVDQATRHVAGTSADKAAIRAFLARGVTHHGAKALCKMVSGGRWPTAVDKRLGKKAAPLQPSAVLRRIADDFVLLQEERHSADYDLVRRFTRAKTLIEVQRAETVLNDRKVVRNGTEKDFFLYMLVTNAGGAGF